MTTTSLTIINARINRLVNWILQEHRNQGGHSRIVLARGKRGLSSRLGMTSETLSRYLAGLSAHGVADGSREIIITDRKAVEGLERSTKPLPLNVDSFQRSYCDSTLVGHRPVTKKKRRASRPAIF
jgi:hypothetical protein